jgi:hypothetical protein|uniref:Uncharacterized protein n=1 Tax=viral metagenome TaxID=1070528 RepID=A0A6C0ITV0_9ZZZZ
MSLKDTTETYLNLDSDQFNSWIKDFDNKYEQVEKSNFNKKDNKSESNINNLILSDSEDSVEIESESDSESEINSNSNIFIRNNTKESNTENTESSFINNTSSANKILMFNKLKTNIKKTNTQSPSNKITINIKEEPNKDSTRKQSNNSESNKDSIRKQSNNSESNTYPMRNQSSNSEYERNYPSNIFSLNQLNSMIPESFTETKNRVEKQNINNEPVNTNRYHKQLGEVALYKFISRRRK